MRLNSVLLYLAHGEVQLPRSMWLIGFQVIRESYRRERYTQAGLSLQSITCPLRINRDIPH